MISVKPKVISACKAALDCYYGRLTSCTKVVKEGHSYAAIFCEGNNKFITFRSSDDPKDWLENLLLFPARPRKIEVPDIVAPYQYDAKVLVHYGFYTAYSRLRSAIDREIRSMDTPETSWTLVGHSLGGACASMCAMNFPLMKRPDLITFGCPKWGSRDANWLLSQRTENQLRFVCGADLVPRITLCRWQHGTPAVNVPGTGQFFSDHSMETYLRGVR